MKIQHLMALVVLSPMNRKRAGVRHSPVPCVSPIRGAVRTPSPYPPKAIREFTPRTLGLLTLAYLLVAVPATAQVNYAISGNTARVANSPNASGDIVIASTYNGYPVTSIGIFAFAGSSLTSVTIPNSVTNIEYQAFRSCTSLTSVTIPNSVTSIGPQPFERCTSLTNLSVDASNPVYSSLNGVLFDKAQTTLITFPPGRGSYVMPDSVTSIGDYAFSQCTSLTNVTIGNGVTSIGRDAFIACTSLTNFTFLASGRARRLITTAAPPAGEPHTAACPP